MKLPRFPAEWEETAAAAAATLDERDLCSVSVGTVVAAGTIGLCQHCLYKNL